MSHADDPRRAPQRTSHADDPRRAAPQRMSFADDPRRVPGQRTSHADDPRREPPQRMSFADDPRREPPQRMSYADDPRREAPQRMSYATDPRREQLPPRPDAPVAKRDPNDRRVGGLVEERASRGRADPRRDPTNPQQIPIRGPNEVFDPRATKIANDPRIESAKPRAPASPRSAQPAAANPAPAVSGRKFPSEHSANPPSATVEGRRYPSQPGGSAPSAAPVEGRRYPSQPGASAPAPRASVASPRHPSHADAPETRARSLMPAAAESGKPPARVSEPRPQPQLYCEIDGLAVEILAQDLSNAGLFVQTPSPPAADSEVRIYLRVGFLTIEALGHVVQSVALDEARRARRRPGFGLLFTEMDDESRAALREAIEVLSQPRREVAPTGGESATRAAISGEKRDPGTAAAPARTSRSPDRTQASAAPAAPETPAAPDPKERELLERLRAELTNVESQPPWTVLGISQSADEACARQAFFAASKKYHPHAYARYALPEIKTVVTQLFIAYKRAFTSMTKSGRGGRTAKGRSGRPVGRASDPGNR